MGVPKGQVSLFQLAEAEIPPENKLAGNIRLGRGNDHAPSGKNDVCKHKQDQDKEDSQGVWPRWGYKADGRTGRRLVG